MSDPVARLAKADAEAAVAKARLKATLDALQDRLEPRRLARTAAREIADTTSATAQRAVTTAKRNPGALVGLAAATGLLLSRHRITELGAALWTRRKATRPPDGR